jgi:hypothetical protein
MELEDWRALAVGLAVGGILFATVGVVWWTPAMVVIATMAVRSIWR